MLIVCLAFGFLLYSLNGSNIPITGFAVGADFKTPAEENGSDLESDFFETTAESFSNEANETGRLYVYNNETLVNDYGGSSGGGGSGETPGYLIQGLNDTLSLWVGGFFVNPYDLFFGDFRFSLYKESLKISEFDLTINSNLDISEVVADINRSVGKSFIHRTNVPLRDIDLFIPRKTGQTKVRVCENASSLDQIYEGCINDSTITKEYVLELGDSGINLSEDGLFFIVKNINGIGAMSEGEIVLDTGLEISLITPKYNSAGFGNLSFYYEVSGDSETDYCSLIIDDQTIAVSYAVLKNNKSNFSIENFNRGKHYWQISCKDKEGKIFNSDKNKITIISKNLPFKLPENIEEINIEKFKNLTLDSLGFGAINFIGEINLTMIENLTDYVYIGKNLISIDSDKIPQLNKPALLTFYNTNFQNPIVLKDGEPCLDCEIISEGENVVFKVESFSSYSLGENSRLEIWDDTDLRSNDSSQGQIYFYANYTNRTSGAAITGATCTIEFNDDSGTMTDNSGIYEYNRTFASNGIYYFNVSCSHGSFANLNETDYVSLGSFSNSPFGANITEIGTSTGPSREPESHDAYAGNVTRLDIEGFSITQSWQGYYGSVTGEIKLANGAGDVLYNWSANNPGGEVYASRSFGINFATVKCANSGEMSYEETFLNQSPSDADRVTNTFNQKNHPEFYVGSTLISANNCNSTNLYDSTYSKTNFFEVILADGTSNIIYTSLLEKDVAGFDSNNYDFEMIVGEDGHNGDSNPTTYYFYAELS